MKTLKTFSLFLVLSWTPIFLGAQQVERDEEGFPTFSYAEGDTVYQMKQYYLVMLYRGEDEAREKSEEDAATIQAAHLAHIQKMAEAGVLSIAGPMGDQSALRGIFIFNLPEKEDVEAWVSGDPAVKSGRLSAEIHSWWAAKGSRLP